MVTRFLLSTAMAAAIVSGAHADQLGNEPRRTDALNAAVARALRTNFEKLQGRVELHDESIDFLFREVAKIDGMQAKVDALMEWIKVSSEDSDQKAVFVAELFKLMCRVLQDQCDLQRRVLALEDELRRRADADNRYGLEPTPIVPPPPAPTPEPEYSPLPQFPPWTGWFYIRDDRRSFCPRARLVALHQSYLTAYGTVHGDLYLTCQGNYVVLRNTPRQAHRSIVAMR